MDFKFNKDAEQRQQQKGSADKGSQGVLLVVLLILVAGFAYIYFFTGMIRPLPEQKQAAAPAPQIVKKPLPPRTPATAPAPAATEAPKIAQTVTATSVNESLKPSEKKPLPAAPEKALPKPVTAKAEVKQSVADKKTVAATDTSQMKIKTKPSVKESIPAASTQKPKKARTEATVSGNTKGSLSIMAGSTCAAFLHLSHGYSSRLTGDDLAVMTFFTSQACLCNMY